MSVGSSDGSADREDFDRTHQMDHLALLGTSSSVSTRSIFHFPEFLLFDCRPLIQTHFIYETLKNVQYFYSFLKIEFFREKNSLLLFTWICMQINPVICELQLDYK